MFRRTLRWRKWRIRVQLTAIGSLALSGKPSRETGVNHEETRMSTIQPDSDENNLSHQRMNSRQEANRVRNPCLLVSIRGLCLPALPHTIQFRQRPEEQPVSGNRGCRHAHFVERVFVQQLVFRSGLEHEGVAIFT
jgi:hypothetical protein